jgi:ribosomal-protein-alanine N-acetyltransferase
MAASAPALSDGLDVVVEPMRPSDMPAVLAIECLAFSSPWPARAYSYEMRNDASHYFVVRRRGGELVQDDASRASPRDGARLPGEPPGDKAKSGLLQRTWQGLRRRGKREIIGYGGFWTSAHRAHISTLAVAPQWRSRRLGLLLMLHMLDCALDLGMTTVTLEVRVSNYVAQNLYRKCGFERSGVHRNYYRDNGEDALLMSTPSLTSPTYRDHLLTLREELRQYLGSGIVRKE